MSRSRGRDTPDPAGEDARPAKPRKERRLARHARHARMVWHDPSTFGPLLRDGMIAIWRSRGGGLYGFGYLVTFVILEVRLVVSEFDASGGLFEFLTDQLLEYLFRLGFMSLANVVLAFLWPLLVIERFQLWGIVGLGLGYLVFERWLRGLIEAQIPELKPPPKKPHRERKGRKRREGKVQDQPGPGSGEDGG